MVEIASIFFLIVLVVARVAPPRPLMSPVQLSGLGRSV